METIISEITNSERAFGGVSCNKLEILDASGNHGLGDIVKGQHDSEITPESGYTWQVINCFEDSIRFSESQIEVDGTTFFQGRLEFRLPKDTADRIHVLGGIGRKRFFVRWIDGNGQGKMMGDQTATALFSLTNRDNKAQREQDNEIAGQFEICSLHPLAFYPFEDTIFDGECCVSQSAPQSGDCTPAIIERTNGSDEDEPWFTAPSGATTVVPAIEIRQENDDVSGTAAAGKAVKIRKDPEAPGAFSVVVESIEESASEIIVNVTPPESDGAVIPQFFLTQITSYRSGDAGSQLAAGTWTRTAPASPESVRCLDFSAADPFNTLVANNQFGHKTRFCDKDGNALTTYGGTAAPDNLVIDTLYNVMWYNVVQSATWNDAVDACVASSQGGFTNWHLPDRVMVESLWNQNESDTNETPGFPNGYHISLWAATTNRNGTTQAWVTHSNQDRQWTESSKTGAQKYIMIRRID